MTFIENISIDISEIRRLPWTEFSRNKFDWDPTFGSHHYFKPKKSNFYGSHFLKNISETEKMIDIGSCSGNCRSFNRRRSLVSIFYLNREIAYILLMIHSIWCIYILIYFSSLKILKYSSKKILPIVIQILIKFVSSFRIISKSAEQKLIFNALLCNCSRLFDLEIRFAWLNLSFVCICCRNSVIWRHHCKIT